MAENSKIEWTDHTVNFWWGCAKVSPACENCYAEGLDARFHGSNGRAPHWGWAGPRRTRVMAAHGEAMRYERRAIKEGRRFRVFTNSMSDFFEDRTDLDLVRFDALDIIRTTPHLDWMILTKRPQHIVTLLQRVLALEPGAQCREWIERWLGGTPPANVWLGATVENQVVADLRIPALLQVPARVRFLSCEPLLGSVDLRLEDCWLGYTPTRDLLHWVICGGESGPKARPMHPDWAKGLRDQCAAAGVPFLFKQWGEWLPDNQNPAIPGPSGASQATRVGKKTAGRHLDGQLHDGYPEVLHA